MHHHRLGSVIVVAGLLGAAACSSSGSSSDPTTTRATATTLAGAPKPGAPAEVTAAGTEWPLPGRDYANSRTATSSIRAANVSTLAPAWSASPGFGPLSTVPIVAQGILYLADGKGVTYALDAGTGKVRWKSAATGFNIGPFGAAIGDGHAYALDGSNGIVAWDLATGKQAWKQTITTTKTEGVDIQPTTFGGLVFASTVPVSIQGIYAGGDRGTIYALDAKTGAVRWSFATVPEGLWGDRAVNSGGGAWYPAAIDTERRVAYFGIANPAPFPGTKEHPNGTSRPGDNLYTDSLVALDVDSGKLLWYHQVTKHDIFDRDQIHALIAKPDGRDVVVSAGKSGVLVGLDPATGKQLWRRAIGRHDGDDRVTLSRATEIFPGTYGGVLTPPATADGIVYAATINAATKLSPDVPAYEGSELGTHDGQVVAVDARDGRVVWDTAVPGDPLGATTVVNDLVFTTLLDGTILALARDDGKIVWKYKAAGGTNGWMSVVGDTLYVPVGNADPAQLLALRLPAK